MILRKPYLIIPKLIEQPTWGGSYIVEMKGWNQNSKLKDKKIGQSYELYGKSKLLLNVNDSTHLIPEFGFADKEETVIDDFPYQHDRDYVILHDIVQKNPQEVLGPKIFEKFGKMPLLNKLTQSLGNSFQLHIKPGIPHSRWVPKAESWYYFENGLLTFGIKKGINVEDYKKACKEVEAFMKNVSNQVMSGEKDIDTAKAEAKAFIQKVNPHQYINIHETKKYDLIDLSMGGLHHSWEEDTERFPLGNVLYEVQEDVMDPVSTIRSFDQGKIKGDGSIREIHIDDYFQALDTDPAHNDITTATKTRQGKRLLTTPKYCLDILEVKDTLKEHTADSFDHLFVRDGDVTVVTDEGSLHLGKGHSCFLSHAVGSYELHTVHSDTVVLKTFIEV